MLDIEQDPVLSTLMQGRDSRNAQIAVLTSETAILNKAIEERKKVLQQSKSVVISPVSISDGKLNQATVIDIFKQKQQCQMNSLFANMMNVDSKDVSKLLDRMKRAGKLDNYKTDDGNKNTFWGLSEWFPEGKVMEQYKHK